MKNLDIDPQGKRPCRKKESAVPFAKKKREREREFWKRKKISAIRKKIHTQRILYGNGRSSRWPAGSPYTTLDASSWNSAVIGDEPAYGFRLSPDPNRTRYTSGKYQ
jgi:hypothetical protein